MSSAVSLRGHHHTCPKVDPGPKPHIGGPISQLQQTFVKINGTPISIKGDACVCIGDGLDKITGGSKIVKINGIPIVRVGDGTEHGGVVTQGNSVVKAD